MLQQFYKDTLQSHYIKYILNNSYIPTVPFTSNIMHVTKGNTYIHDGYFVTAKKSDAVAAIKEDISNTPELYSTYFKKGEPYIFGEQYNGLTTSYKSNTKGYDSETHYYLGEYLRAYKAHYNIDLMPFYNCYSNEYLDYVYLDKDIQGKVILKEKRNQKYSIISVPIKFCQNYTIALQCNTEVRMMPVFVGRKGILQVKTSELNQIDYWGKSFSRIDFKSPVYFEAPHINSVNDNIQAALQTYDKYLRLLIQIPANVSTSIVVLEGKYSNTKPFQEKIFNLSQEDVSTLWKQYYDTKIPSNEAINIPKESTAICSDLSRQKLFLNGDNIVFSIGDSLSGGNLNVLGKVDFKFEINTDELNDDTTLSINTLTNSSNRLIRSLYSYKTSGANTLKIPTNWLCWNLNKDSSNSDEYKNIKINHGSLTYEGSGGTTFNIKEDHEFTFQGSNPITWLDFNGTNDDSVPLVSACFDSDGTKAIRQIVAVKEGENGFSLYACELSFYLDPERDLKLDGSKLVNFNGNDTILSLNNLKINLPDEAGYIQMSPIYPQESAWEWDLKSLKSNTYDRFFSEYLNQHLISNLSLLIYNDGMSYAFSGRLLEYLVNSVISSNEKIPKNISRIQKSLMLTPTDIYSNDLRVKTYRGVVDKAEAKRMPLPEDMNGFLDKDSENFLTILN